MSRDASIAGEETTPGGDGGAPPIPPTGGAGPRGRVRRLKFDAPLILAFLAFGAAIGLTGGLSKQVGTTATLIGLLVTLVGGTLVPLVKSGEASLEQRRQTFLAAGIASSGLVLGLLGAFMLRWVETNYWIPRQRDAYVTFLAALKEKGLITGGVSATLPSGLTGAESSLTLQSYAPAQGSAPLAEGGASGPPELSLRTADEALSRLRELRASKPDQFTEGFLEDVRDLRGFAYVRSAGPKALEARIDEIVGKIPDGSPRELLQLREALRRWRSQLR